MGAGNIKSMPFYKMGVGIIKSKICVAHFPVTASVFPVTAPIFDVFTVSLKHSPLPISVSILGHWQVCPALAEVGSLWSLPVACEGCSWLSCAVVFMVAFFASHFAAFCRDPSFLGTSFFWPLLALFVSA